MAGTGISAALISSNENMQHGLLLNALAKFFRRLGATRNPRGFASSLVTVKPESIGGVGCNDLSAATVKRFGLRMTASCAPIGNELICCSLTRSC
jgi:hypothetical protein